LTSRGETTTTVTDVGKSFECIGQRQHWISVGVESKQGGIVEDPVVEEVGNKYTEILVHYGSSVSVIVKTEYSEVGGDMMRVRLYFLVGRPLEDIGAQLLEESCIVG
jgi:hypothetical protein